MPLHSPVTGSLKGYDFIVQEKNGAPTVFEDPTPLSARYSARTWMSMPAENIIIPEQESLIIPFTITAPLDAIPGEKYAAIFFERNIMTPVRDNRENNTNVYTESRIGSLITIRIPGTTREKATASSFSVDRISEYGPVTIDFEIRNNGSNKIKPKGTLIITDMLGKSIEEQILPEYNIFPDASRLYKFTIGNQWMIGKYHLKLSALYGERGQSMSQSTNVWIIPWKVVVTLTLFLLILYFLMKHLHKAPTKSDDTSKNTDRLLKQSRKRE